MAGRFIWGLVPLLCLGLIVHGYALPRIESRLGAAATRLAGEYGWARIAMSGRDVFLDGIAPARVDTVEVKARLEALAGVRKVVDRTEIMKTVRPFVLSIAVTGEHVRIAGYVDSDQTRVDLEKNAHLAGRRIDTELALASGAPGYWRSAVEFAVRAADELENGSVLLVGDRIVVDGTSRRDPPGQAEERLRRSVPADTKLLIRLASGAGGRPYWTVTVGMRSVVLGGMIRSETDHNDMFERASFLFPDRRVIDFLTVEPSLPADWRPATQALLDRTARLMEGRAVISGRSMRGTLTGRVLTLTALAEATDGLQRDLPDRYEVEADLSLVEPGRRLSRVACQATLDAMLGRERMRFDTSGSKLSRNSRYLVDNIAFTLRQCGHVRVSVEGHTADYGDVGEENRMSVMRAESVASELTASGIEADRVAIRGFGARRPAYANDTAYGRERNNRVEIRISE